MAYPNLIAEMARLGIDSRSVAEVVDRSPDTVNNWLKGKGDFPICKAFAVQSKFFPNLPLAYLFSTSTITAPVQSN